MRNLICTVLIAVMLLAAPAAMAERDDGPEPAPGWLMAVDYVLVRPHALWIASVSTGAFIALLPITYLIGAATGPRSLATYMVATPWRFATSRYPGNFSEYRDHRTILGAEIVD